MNNSVSLPKPLLITGWILRVAAAVILLQTLFFKFTGAPESVYIFTVVGQEPWGRIGSGVIELIASILLVLPIAACVATGALLAIGVMSGAILFHLTKLKIVVQDDGGTLFALAVIVWISSAVLLGMYRRALPLLGARL
ncbi:MAG TPA: DoxX family protein [Opitutaceae bacterium]|nr:DoxX family protein [Opitutaceae bacterium]